MVMPGETGLLELLGRRDLPSVGGVPELCCQVFQLRRLSGIVIIGSLLRRLLKIAGDLGHELVELARILFLKLLQLIQEASSR